MGQLNREQRYTIFILLQQNFTQAQVAAALNISKSTVSRELKRNSGKHGYSWRQAQEKADLRKERLREPRKMCGQVKHRIEKYMREEQLSPEQIVGLCRRKGYLMVCKSSIYNYIHRDKDNGGDLWKECPHKLKHRHRPVGKHLPIKNRVGIDKRPSEVDGKRFGDWELDLMSDSDGNLFKLTLVENSSLLSFIANLPHGKDSHEVAKKVVSILLPYKRFGALKTITADNGPEFADHEYITKKLGVPVYFTDPYCSWQKGRIENTNKLYRRYLPRNPALFACSDEDLTAIQNKLNKRPRKKISFFSPREIFFLSLKN